MVDAGSWLVVVDKESSQSEGRRQLVEYRYTSHTDNPAIHSLVELYFVYRYTGRTSLPAVRFYWKKLPGGLEIMGPLERECPYWPAAGMAASMASACFRAVCLPFSHTPSMATPKSHAEVEEMQGKIAQTVLIPRRAFVGVPRPSLLALASVSSHLSGCFGMSAEHCLIGLCGRVRQTADAQ